MDRLSIMGITIQPCAPLLQPALEHSSAPVVNRVTPGTQPRGLVQGVVEESITSAKATIGRATISSADAPDGLARSDNEMGTAP